jgi:N-acetylglucosamine kinase-like BadF-type ATPase
MSANLSRRPVQAVDELAGVAEVIGLKFGEAAKIAVLQLQRAVSELIEAAEPAASDEGMDQSEIDRLRAAIAGVKGGAA